MAKFLLAKPWDVVHGAIKGAGSDRGQVLFSANGLNIMRSNVIPNNPESALQTLARSYMSAAANGFQALTEVQATAWRTAAAALSRTDILGQEYTYSGIGLYVQVNTLRLMDGQSLVATPPTVDLLGQITSFTSVTDATGFIDVIVVHSLTPATGQLRVRFSPPLGSQARNARNNEFRTLSSTFAASMFAVDTSPQTLHVPISTFTIASGDRVGVEVTSISDNYYVGTPVRDRNIAVA